ncbi:hypothetical protein [Colwellia sp. C1TZA3]|uniref:hypothetical protein n=1 Tax=Colwellia sp. C1TZA3 TaxID=2508879 RepID=UPI0011BFA576|nr:hypothetical protein [Colwellia sp. C1TZA3]
MSSKQFQNILHHVTHLNYSQLKKLCHEVESNISNNQVGQAIADHEETISHCPYCNSHELNRWGMTKQVIPIPLSYCSLVLVKIAQGCVALNPNSQLLLNRAPYLELFFLRTTRSQT